ncbi:MAG: glycerophosphodiester phosphodiesterase [Candidatus Binataceae bacterium]
MRSRIDTDFFAPPRPRVIAHRGASGHYPENTLPAFRAACDFGARYIELDVRMTRDGEIVVAHDENLERMCAHAGTIAGTTLGDLRRLDAGHNFAPADGEEFPFRGRAITIPTLAEVLSEFPNGYFIVEMKQVAPGLAAPLLRVVERAGMRRRVLVASEHQAPLDEFRRLAPDIPTNFPYREIAAFMMSLPPGTPRFIPLGDALQIPPIYESWRIVSVESVAAAHRLGVEVHVWTINQEAQMREMLTIGVDGVITDFPDRLLAIL